LRKHYFISVILFFVLASCQKQNDKETSLNNDSIVKSDSVPIDNVDKHTAQNALDYLGVYKGVLPCADCEGIQTTITLNENFTYSIKTQYLGKGAKVFEQNGMYKWNDKVNMLVLGDSENVPRYYFVGENMLTQLDMSGKKNTGDLADNYQLNKEISSLETITNSEENPTSEKLNNRMVVKTVIKEVDPAEGKFTLAKTKWKLIELNGKKVRQKGDKAYFIKLNSNDGKFNGYAGCNTFSGNYVMPLPRALAFTNIVLTRMACPNMELETQVLAMIETVDNYRIKSDILYLRKTKMTTVAKFEAVK
jgi:heat shock protein HslJ/uncharacterized lipoprotein NlpE involved in copper resistance